MSGDDLILSYRDPDGVTLHNVPLASTATTYHVHGVHVAGASGVVIDANVEVGVDYTEWVDDGSTAYTPVTQFEIGGIHAEYTWEGTDYQSHITEVTEDAIIKVYKYFPVAVVDGSTHYGTLQGIVLENATMGSMNGTIIVESTGGSGSIYGISSRFDSADMFEATKQEYAIKFIGGSITLTADDAETMRGIDNEDNSSIGSINSTIIVTNHREDAIVYDSTDTTKGVFGIYNAASGSIGDVEGSITVNAQTSRAFGIDSMGSIGNISADIDVHSSGYYDEDGLVSEGSNAWGIMIQNDDFGNITSNSIKVEAGKDAYGILLLTGETSDSASKIDVGTITVTSNNYDEVDGTTHEGNPYEAKGISLDGTANIESIHVDNMTVTAEVGDATGIYLTTGAKVGTISGTINVSNNTDATYTRTDGTIAYYNSEGIRNYYATSDTTQEAEALELANLTINVTGKGDNVGIQVKGGDSNLVPVVNFSGDVSVNATGGVANEAVRADNAVILRQSINEGATAANVTLQGDLDATEGVTFDSGTYVLKGSNSWTYSATDGTNHTNVADITESGTGISVTYAATSGSMVINQYSASSEVQAAFDQQTQLDVQSDLNMNGNKLTFNITADLSDVLMVVSDESDVLNISTVEVVLSCDYYTELMAEAKAALGADATDIEIKAYFEQNNTFTVIGAESIDLLSCFETVDFALMYYDESGNLIKYEDTDESMAIFENDAIDGDVLTDDSYYDADGVYTYYTGHYDFCGPITLNVPEPSTATLSLMALAGLLARRRRKNA